MEQLYRAFNANTMYGIRMAMGAGCVLNMVSMDFVRTISVPTEKGKTMKISKTEEKALHFVAALADVYRDEENRELVAFSKMEITNDFTEDFTAMLLAMNLVCEQLTGYDGDLIDFTHMLNKLAIQHIMEKGKEIEE